MANGVPGFYNLTNLAKNPQGRPGLPGGGAVGSFRPTAGTPTRNQGSGSYNLGVPGAAPERMERGALNELYGQYGYNLDARPFDYDQSVFNDPYRAANRANLAGREGVATQRGGQSFADALAARSEMVGGLKQVAGMYLPTAQGTGPSIADQVFQRTTDQNIANTLAMRAINARGGNLASASRGASYAMGDAQRQASIDAAIQRQAEVENARRALLDISGQFGQVRAQDVATGAQHDQMVQYYLSQGLNLDQAQWQAAMNIEQLRAAEHRAAQDRHLGSGGTGNFGDVASIITGGLQAAGSAGGQAIAMSDVREKEEIEPIAATDIDEFLNVAKGYKYKYKAGVEDEREHFGVMAQELEKSRIGKSMVMETPKGKVVNFGHGFAAVVAALAELNDRMKTVEGASA